MAVRERPVGTCARMGTELPFGEGPCELRLGEVRHSGRANGKMTMRTFKEHYGENRAIAALAVVEDEATAKKRIIHDASRGVRVNRKIKCRDKIRTPWGGLRV